MLTSLLPSFRAAAAEARDHGRRLLETTQPSLRHYVAPTTNTIIPLLHIVPSKTDAARLIPMSPDLVKVLLAVQRRARGEGSTIPLSVRYDPTEKVFSDPLPHLFARLVGARQEVLSMAYIRKILHQIATRAGTSDAGAPVHFTPHDFRRLFSTDLVGSGLPMHIVASLLGHLNLETTRGYTAVFPEEVVQAHQAFHRGAWGRATRGRVPTGDGGGVGRLRAALPAAQGRARRLSPAVRDAVRARKRVREMPLPGRGPATEPAP